MAPCLSLPYPQPQHLHQRLGPSFLGHLVRERALVQCEQRDPLRRRRPPRDVVEHHRFEQVVLLRDAREGEGEGETGGGGLEGGDGGVGRGDEGEVELGVGVEGLGEEG